MNKIKVGSPLVFKQADLESPMKLDTSGFSTPKSRDSGGSDRFIPNRVCSNLYSLFLTEGSKDDKPKPQTADTIRDDQNSQIYSNLLQTHILG